MRILFIVLFIPALTFASGNKVKPTIVKPTVVSGSKQAPSTKADKNYKYIQEDPKPKKEKDLKEYLFSLPRKGLTINKFDYQQARFTLKGTYKTERELTTFLDRLKNSIRSESKFDLKTYKTSFAGSSTNHYEVTSDNAF